MSNLSGKEEPATNMNTIKRYFTQHFTPSEGKLLLLMLLTPVTAFYLMQFVFPALLGMVLLSNPLLSLIEIFTLPMMYLFMGAVLGGVPLVLREAKIKKFKPIMILYVLIGAAIVLLINLIPENAMTQTQGIAGVCIHLPQE